jgi:hypothetical protein
MRAIARWLCWFVALGWGLPGAAALLLMLLVHAGWAGADSAVAPLVVGWGFLLFAWGVRDPWVDSGGGFVWLTEFGVMVVYLVPAGLAVILAVLLGQGPRQQRFSRTRNRSR